MSEVLQFAFSGLTTGSIYALVALGFTLIYNASDVVNFAQGEFVMLGGMVTVFAAAAWGSLAAGRAVRRRGRRCGRLLLLHRLAIEPARGASAVTLIIITIGASILMRGLAAVIFDKSFHSLPPFAGNQPWQIGGAALLPQSMIVLPRLQHHRLRAVGLPDAHTGGQGHAGDRRQPPRCASGRDQHVGGGRSLVCHLRRHRCSGRHSRRPDHPYQL
jgi:hypothetical protein